MHFDLPHAGEVYATACALFWAIAVILFRHSSLQTSPVALNLLKNAVGLPLFFATLLLLGIPLFPESASAADWALLLASGGIGIAVADSLFFASLARLGAGRSAIVDSLYSPFIILCSFVYLREPLRPGLVLAVVLMIGAIFLGSWKPDPKEGEADSKRLRYGVLLGVLSMFLMAAAIVAVKPILTRSDPWWASTVRLLGGELVLVVQALHPSHRAEVRKCFRPGPLWKTALPGGVIGAYLSMFFWIAGMTYGETTTAGVLNQTSIVFVLVFASIFLGEPLTRRRVAAIALGFAGGVLVLL